MRGRKVDKKSITTSASKSNETSDCSLGEQVNTAILIICLNFFFGLEVGEERGRQQLKKRGGQTEIQILLGN